MTTELTITIVTGIDLRVWDSQGQELASHRYGDPTSTLTLGPPALPGDITWEILYLGVPRTRGGITWHDGEWVFDRGPLPEAYNDIMLRVIRDQQIWDQRTTEEPVRFTAPDPAEFWQGSPIVVIFGGQTPPMIVDRP